MWGLGPLVTAGSYLAQIRQEGHPSCYDITREHIPTGATRLRGPYSEISDAVVTGGGQE